MMILWVVLGLAALVLALLLIAVARTLLTPSKRSDYVPDPDGERAMEYAGKLSEMVRYNTVSIPGTDQRDLFLGFHKVLESLFPLVHRNLEKTEIDGNLLFFWKGRSSSRPLVLMSHQDVVPADGPWSRPPFSGEIVDGHVWGRGTSDTKCSVMAFFQAVEELLGSGYVPENDVYLSSSCTEEWNGDGCSKLVSELERRGVRPYLVCDEGGGIISEPVGGIPGNFAMVGVFEKGKASVKLTARSTGGHASAPKKHTPLARLSDFIAEFEHGHKFRRRLPKEVAAMFRTLGPYASFPLKLVFCNLWLFKPILLRVLPAISAQAGAMIQTTIAFTMASGSDACNVMPSEASLGCDLRFIPHQGMDESLAIVKRLADKHGLEMDVLYSADSSNSTDIKGDAFRLVKETISKTFPGCACSPYVMTGGTDARFYERICDNVVRFAPVVYGPDQMKGMHGLDETIGIDCLPGAVDFYKNLIDAVR